MFNGGHVVIYSKDAEADRRMFKDVLGLANVDVGGGWLIFSLPPSEVAFHPHESSTAHDFYFMCDDIHTACEKLDDHGIEYSESRLMKDGESCRPLCFPVAERSGSINPGTSALSARCRTQAVFGVSASMLNPLDGVSKCAWPDTAPPSRPID